MKNIKELRLQANLSQIELSKKLGIAQNTLSQYENGNREPDIEMLQKIANELNVSLDYLIGRTSFKNEAELFDSLGISSDGFFEAAFDFGKLLKVKREKLGLSVINIADALNLTQYDIENIEEGILPINYDLAERYAKVLDTTISKIFSDNEMYDEQILENYKNNIDSYKNFTKIAEIKSKNEKYKHVANGRGVRINVYSRIPAGMPLEAIEDIVDFEDIPVEMVKGGQEYIGIKVSGDSMQPKYIENDTVIVQLQADCENGQDCAVYVNGYDVTLKKVLKQDNGIMLQPLNPNYEAKFYPYDGKETVTILGVVVELRRKL